EPRLGVGLQRDCAAGGRLGSGYTAAGCSGDGRLLAAGHRQCAARAAHAMNILLLLIPISLVLLGIGIAAFLWAVRSGQFDDLESPGLLALLDDRAPRQSKRAAAEVDDETAAVPPADQAADELADQAEARAGDRATPLP